MSVGNEVMEIQLDKSPTTLISGKNGVGKSSIIVDSIMYALYGKAYRNINKPNLINSITRRNMLVELEFDIGKKKYKVRRGEAPGVFEIYENGKLIRQDARALDYQKQFEKNILKINERSCRQLIILGAANYVPFMQLPLAARRGIIEDLLDIQVFSVMSALAKEKVASLGNELQIVEGELRNLQASYETLQNQSERKKDQDKEFLQQQKEQIAEIDKRIKELDKLRQSALRKKESTLAKFDLRLEAKFKKQQQDIKHVLTKYEMTTEKIDKEIEFFENNESCPTCQQPITTEFKNSRLCSHKKKKSDIVAAGEKLTENLEKLRHELDKIATISYQVGEFERLAQSYGREIELETHKKDEIFRLAKKYEERVASDNKELIKEVKTKLKSAARRKEALIKEREIAQTCVLLLKDDGIKSSIIKKYIPVINAQVNKYLEEMEFFCDFEFDENFKEQIRARGRDEFGYNSFSQGEKARLDLSLLLTFRDIAKMRNAVSTNLLIMDEVTDSSLDELGVTGMLNILGQIDKCNIFLVSHKNDLYDKMYSHIEFEKVKGFTKIKQSIQGSH